MVVGGTICCPYEWLNEAEIYDPVSQTWKQTNTKTTNANGRMVVLQNGQTLAAGGVEGAQPTATIVTDAELFNPTTGQWTTTGRMAIDRNDHTLTLLQNGQVLAAGGNGGSWGNNFDRPNTELYDPATGTWSLTGSLTTPRFLHTATLLPNGKVLVTGGSDEEGNIYSSAEFYTPKANALVSSFSLINADTDKGFRSLKDGDTINLAALPTLHLNVRANTTPYTVDSVAFSLSGAENREHTEKGPPYALFNDDNGNYHSWTPHNGVYSLTAIPYLKGEAGTSLTIHFTITTLGIDSLVLVNAQTDKDLQPLHSGDVIDLSTLPTRLLNIRAATNPPRVGSVVFNLDKWLQVTENHFPYAIGGDVNGNFRAWTLPSGDHKLTITPYEKANGSGIKGVAYTVSFKVIDPLGISNITSRNALQTIDGKEMRGSISAMPNPFTNNTTLSFSVPKSAYTTVAIYDSKGVLVDRLYQAVAEAGKVYQVAVNNKNWSSGTYIIQLIAGDYSQSYKLILSR